MLIQLATDGQYLGLKGLCHEMNICLKAYNNKWVLSVHALIVFTIFCSLVDEKIKIKVLACSFEITGVPPTDQPDTTSTVRTSIAPQIEAIIIA